MTTPSERLPPAAVRWFLGAGLLAVIFLLAGPMADASAADPLYPQQDWLQRSVPPALPLPSRRPPPIAIIEDGYDDGHPDMRGGWVAQKRITPGPLESDEEGVRRYFDGLRHGTEVASVIGAPLNGHGIQGVLPGARVWVYGSDGSCPDVARAIRKAVHMGAKVINASYGFFLPGACRAHRDATSYAYGRGALVIAAAGNEHQIGQPWSQPANDFHVLTVGAVNAFNQPTYFSNQKTYTDLVAPGEGVLVAVPMWADTEDTAKDGYARLDGTSYAAPIVSAIAAWVMAERPRLSVDQVADLLRSSAYDLGRPGWDISTGFGHVNLVGALRGKASFHDRYEPNDDIPWVAGRKGLRARRPLLKGKSRLSFAARLDIGKDPFDVYPVWVPARSAVRITMTPTLHRSWPNPTKRASFIGADLYGWSHNKRTAFGRGAIAKSRRKGARRERIVIRNRSKRARRMYVEVRAVRGRLLAGNYRIALKRLKS